MICTASDKEYSYEAVRALDPAGTLFRRSDYPTRITNTSSKKSLLNQNVVREAEAYSLPMTLVIDDRDDVWEAPYTDDPLYKIAKYSPGLEGSSLFDQHLTNLVQVLVKLEWQVFEVEIRDLEAEADAVSFATCGELCNIQQSLDRAKERDKERQRERDRENESERERHVEKIRRSISQQEQNQRDIISLAEKTKRHLWPFAEGGRLPKGFSKDIIKKIYKHITNIAEKPEDLLLLQVLSKIKF